MPTIQTTKVYKQVDDAVKQGFTTISAQGSARASKTYNILIWLIVYILNHPGTRVSIVRATLPSIKGSVYVDFKEILLRLGLWSDKNMNKSEMTYTLANGSLVEFFSTDQEQKLRGRKRNICFVNEANELSYLEWKQLKMRTTKFSIIDYNPSFGEDHWINELNNDEETFHFITTYKDNPFLEDTIIREIESYKTKNKSLWQVYGLGIRSVIEGLIFPDVEVVDEVPEYVKKHYRGMDFGFSNDPTAIVDVYPYQDILYIDELCYRTEMVTSDIVKVLKDNGMTVDTISESADPRLVQEIYRAGVNIFPVKKFPGSIDAGLNKMKEYSIKVTKRSYNVIKEFKNYTWSQDKEGKFINVPIDSYNHAIDAIRYVVMMRLMGGKPNPVNLTRLASLAH